MRIAMMIVYVNRNLGQGGARPRHIPFNFASGGAFIAAAERKIYGKKERIYLAVFEPAGNGGYGVYFPDVLGCVSYGDNFMEAKEMAHEALQLHLDWMVRDGDEIPESTLRVSEEDLEDDCIVVGIKVLV